MNNILRKCRLCLQIAFSGSPNLFSSLNGCTMADRVLQLLSIEIEDTPGWPTNGCNKCIAFLHLMATYQRTVMWNYEKICSASGIKLDSLACHLCLMKSGKEIFNLSQHDNGVNYSEMVMDMLDMDNSKAPGWPSSACEKCYQLLKEIKAFQIRILSCHKSLFSEILNEELTEIPQYVVGEEAEREPAEPLPEIKPPQLPKPTATIIPQQVPRKSTPVHTNILPQPTFKCPSCGKSFSPREALHRHIAQEHVTKRRIHLLPFQCKICFKKCTGGQELSDHLLMHHRKGSGTGRDTQPAPPETQWITEAGSSPGIDTTVGQERDPLSPEGVEGDYSFEMIDVPWESNPESINATPLLPVSATGQESPEVDKDRAVRKRRRWQHDTGDSRVCSSGWTTREERRLEALMVHKKIFVCQLCHKDTKAFWVLQAHVKRKHECAQEYLICCDLRLGSKTWQLYDHFRLHVDKSVFSCRVCWRRYKGALALEAHMRQSHAEREQLHCRVCGKAFHSALLHGRHEKTHESYMDSSVFCCEYCGKGLSNNRTLKRHLRFTHGVEVSCTCDTCGREFDTPRIRLMHMKEHVGEHNDKGQRSKELS